MSRLRFKHQASSPERSDLGGDESLDISSNDPRPVERARAGLQRTAVTPLCRFDRVEA